MRKRMRRATALLVSVLVMLTGLSCIASATSEKQPIGKSEYTGLDVYEINGGQSFKIRLQLPSGPGLPGWPLTEKAANAFMKDYPNVEVVMDGVGDSATWRQNAAVEFAGSDPPAISWVVPSYANSFIKDGLIIDWRGVYANPRHAYFSEFLPEYVRENVAAPGGELPFLPHEGQIGHVYYNIGIFEEHGWTPPKTFDELIELCDKMNAVGVVPYGCGGADFRYAWLATQLMVRVCGIENTRALATKDFDKWADPAYGFPQTMEKLQQLIDHKFFHPGVNGITMNVDEPAMLVAGEFAMNFEGVWKSANFIKAGGLEWAEKNLGVFPFPAMTDEPNGTPDCYIGGTPAGYIISAKQPDYKIEAAIELAKYLTCPAFMKELIETGISIPAGKVSYDESLVPRVTREIYANYLNATTIIGPMDGLAADASIDMALKKEVIPMMISGEMNAQQAVERMDSVAKAAIK